MKKTFTLENVKTIFYVIAWFAALALVAFATSCSPMQTVKMSKSQKRIAKVDWKFDHKIVKR